MMLSPSVSAETSRAGTRAVDTVTEYLHSESTNMRCSRPWADRAILVVDDDPGIRALLMDLLSDEGYPARSAIDGSEALDLLASGFRPCLILLDLNMPVMSGWEFCAAQQQHADLAQLPVALMSAANDLRADQLPCRPAAVCPKPFDIDQLLSIIGMIAA